MMLLQRVTLLQRVIAHWRSLWPLVALFVAQLAVPSAAYAASTQPAAPTHNHTLPYLLVMLCLALALILLCRSASRSKDLRLEELDED
jgi:hypothetical protein